MKVCDCKTQPVLQKFEKFHMSKSAKKFGKILFMWVKLIHIENVFWGFQSSCIELLAQKDYTKSK